MCGVDVVYITHRVATVHVHPAVNGFYSWTGRVSSNCLLDFLWGV